MNGQGAKTTVMLVLVSCYGGWSLSRQGDRYRQAGECEEAVWGKDVALLTETEEAGERQVHGEGGEVNFNILTDGLVYI